MSAPLLNFVTYDSPGSGRPCLIAHGLFGSARNWNAIAKRLSAQRPVVAVDMRNHGHSFWSDAHGYADLASDLGRVIDNLGHGPVDLLGHSMGGKAAMALALSAPDRVARLIVADIAPVGYTHDQTQHIDAMRAVDLSHVARRSDAAAQLGARGLAPALQSFFTQSLDVPARKWRMNLEALADQMPHIMGFPDFTTDYDEPCLFLAGENSDYVQRAHRGQIKALFPRARFAKLQDAGHWLHAEKPKEFVATVELFFS